jgi:hypothetical protein
LTMHGFPFYPYLPLSNSGSNNTSHKRL